MGNTKMFHKAQQWRRLFKYFSLAIFVWFVLCNESWFNFALYVRSLCLLGRLVHHFDFLICPIFAILKSALYPDLQSPKNLIYHLLTAASVMKKNVLSIATLIALNWMGLPAQQELLRGAADIILAYSYTADLDNPSDNPPHVGNK